MHNLYSGVVVAITDASPLIFTILSTELKSNVIDVHCASAFVQVLH